MAGIFAVERHPKKAQILQQIMEGRSLRAISLDLVPPISVMSLQRYKVRVINPVLMRKGSYSAQKKTTVTSVVPVDDPMVVRAASQAIREAPVLSVFRTRLESVHGRIERAMDRVERNEKEFPMLPPLINQMQKNLELLGRVTGELEQQGTTSVSIQIVCPSAPTPELTPRISYADDNATTYTASEISVTQLPPD